jgi:hypothetical protein
MAEWHYVVDGKPVGPVTTDDISQVFREGVVQHETLVWTEGMPEWRPIHEVEAFDSLTHKSAPPPLPGSPPAVLSVEPDPVSALDIDVQVKLSNLRVSEPRIPWTRYFARLFDISVLGTLILTAAMLVSPYIDQRFFLTIYTADEKVLMLFALPFIMVLNAIIITVFGNSMGKKLFGIHAMSVQADRPFTLMENLSREMSVWARGLALGIPFVNFFTMIPAYRRVADGKPTVYDEGIASVREYSDSAARRTIGIVVTLLVLGAIVASNAIDKNALERVSRPYTWTNPVTRMTTTIPGGWESETIPGPDGGTLYAFTNLKTGVVAFLAVETYKQHTLVSYADALETSLSDTMKFDDDWSRYDLPEVWLRNATVKEGGHPSALLLRQVDTSFWRVVYINQLGISPELVSPSLTRALFASVGVK